MQEVLDALAARRLNRQRLPLMVLGFLGPLLALLITAFFSYRGYARAVQNAEHGYSVWALQNDQFAAQLAAEKVTGQLTRYFELAHDEAQSSALLTLFFTVADQSAALQKLNDLKTPSDELETIRAVFRTEAERSGLERYLESRMAEYHALAKRDWRVPRFASLFVTDGHGTQLASAFDDKSVSLSIGKNWAHRTYFHGGVEEMSPFERAPANPTHIDRTHLSAVYFSSSQQTWKLAISTPIYRTRGGEQEFSGILVLTVDLGDFQLSAGTTKQDHEQFLVLVDAREGPDQGIILHHPLFEELDAEGKEVPSELLKPEYRVPRALIRGEGQTNYHDPLGKFGDPLAKAYDRRWLAASAHVLPPVGAAEHSESGLVVMVQSDYHSVVRPARQLGQQFIRNSFWMFVVMLTVSFSLWYIVVRMFREPTAGLHRAPTPVPESTALYEATTMPAARQE